MLKVTHKNSLDILTPQQLMQHSFPATLTLFFGYFDIMLI